MRFRLNISALLVAPVLASSVMLAGMQTAEAAELRTSVIVTKICSTTRAALLMLLSPTPPPPAAHPTFRSHAFRSPRAAMVLLGATQLASATFP